MSTKMGKVQPDREDFPKSYVRRKYIEQDGVCANCDNPLEKGFHRDHKDGDRRNAAYENLQLICIECHFVKTEDDALERHHKLERDLLEQVSDAIEKTLAKELKGADLERILEAMTLKLRISRIEKGIDRATEYPPPVLKALANLQERKAYQQMYLQGYKEGLAEKIDIAARPLILAGELDMAKLSEDKSTIKDLLGDKEDADSR